MKILFNQVVGGGKHTISVQGKIITVNGDTLDLSTLELGSVVPSDAIDNPIVGEVSVTLDGIMTVTINYPVNKDTCPIGYTLAKELDVVDGEVNPTMKYQPTEVLV